MSVDEVGTGAIAAAAITTTTTITTTRSIDPWSLIDIVVSASIVPLPLLFVSPIQQATQSERERTEIQGTSRARLWLGTYRCTRIVHYLDAHLNTATTLDDTPPPPQQHHRRTEILVVVRVATTAAASPLSAIRLVYWLQRVRNPPPPPPLPLLLSCLSGAIRILQFVTEKKRERSTTTNGPQCRIQVDHIEGKKWKPRSAHHHCVCCVLCCVAAYIVSVRATTTLFLVNKLIHLSFCWCVCMCGWLPSVCVWFSFITEPHRDHHSSQRSTIDPRMNGLLITCAAILHRGKLSSSQSPSTTTTSMIQWFHGVHTSRPATIFVEEFQHLWTSPHTHTESSRYNS